GAIAVCVDQTVRPAAMMATRAIAGTARQATWIMDNQPRASSGSRPASLIAARTRVKRNGADAAASMSDSLALAAFSTSLPTRSSSSFRGLFDLNIRTSPAASVYRAHHQKTIKNPGKLQKISPVFLWFRLQVPLQHTPEICPSAMSPHFHFRNRPFGDFGDFSHRKAFHV